MFPLCSKCCDSLQTTPCTCKESERCLTGCWVISEIIEAVKRGYRIQKVFEVYHFPESSQYGGLGSDEGLFKVRAKKKYIDPIF